MIQKKTFFKLLSVYLVFAVAIISLPAQGWAMFIPAGQAGNTRQDDVRAIQKTLESTVVKQRLMDFGLSSEEAMARINTLSDDQIHQFASRLDAVQAGADGLDVIVFLLVVAIIVVVVLEATGHHVIVK